MATKTINLTGAEVAVTGFAVQPLTVASMEPSNNLLTDYKYISDNSVKCNDITYTVEKDNATGLIPKISDSNGNSFEPTINSEITDVALHNAVFWAVAMARGIGSPQFVMNGIFGMFTPDTRDIANSRWRNSISGYNDMILSGGSINGDAVHFNAGEYGSFVCDEPNTVYYVGKLICDDTNAQEYHPMVGKQLTSKKHGYGFDLYGYCNYNSFCSLMFSGYAHDIDSSVNSSQYHVVCYTRNSNIATFYVDGIMIGTENAYKGYYNGNMLLNKSSRGGTPSILDFPKESFIKYCAFGISYHDEATVQKNMAYLMKKYIEE